MVPVIKFAEEPLKFQLSSFTVEAKKSESKVIPEPMTTGALVTAVTAGSDSVIVLDVIVPLVDVTKFIVAE